MEILEILCNKGKYGGGGTDHGREKFLSVNTLRRPAFNWTVANNKSQLNIFQHQNGIDLGARNFLTRSHDSVLQGATKRCRLSLLTNSALVYESKCGGRGGVEGSQLMSTAVHIT